MQYIIMSNGKGTRWNNYLGITKQEAKINNERIIDRIVRLINERTKDPIYILSSNANHENSNAKRIESCYCDYFHSKYASDYLNEPTTYLYGDTYYTEEAIDIILNTNVSDILFFGNERAIVGVKVQDYKFLKCILDTCNLEQKSLYHCFDNIDDKNRFVNIGNTFSNINNSKDYEFLKLEKENNKKLILKLRGKHDR